MANTNSGKTLQTRIQLKHDIAANWTTAGNNNFKPLTGEAIIYDVDPDAIIYNNRAPKVKIGDGTKKPNDLIGLLNEYEEADDGYYSSFLYPGVIDIGAYQQEKSILLDSGIGININDNSDNLAHKTQITPQGVYFSHITSNNDIGFTKDSSILGVNFKGSLILNGEGSSQLVCKPSSSSHILDESGHSLFGLTSNAKLSVGNTSQSLSFSGLDTRPTYNDTELGLIDDVNLKVSRAGDTMTGELIFNGGDKSGGSKIVLETGKGQITNSGTSTLFGFTAAGTIAVGHSSYILAMRGSGSKPKYNSKDIALQEDVDTKVAKAGDIMTGRLQINMSNPHIHMKDTEYSTDWYFQAHQDQLAFGPTFATAVKTDKNGNMTVPGTVTVGNKVTMQYNSSTESLDFTFA